MIPTDQKGLNAHRPGPDSSLRNGRPASNQKQLTCPGHIVDPQRSGYIRVAERNAA
jgi:hypothetical protein